MQVITSLLTFILYAAALATAADTAAWKSRTIYFALTDRIARTSGDTGGSSCSNLGSYCGGTFKGLESKLDYIKGMGFDAIWITPVVANSAGGYHGYWAQDLYSVNSNYGTADDLKSLVSSAHSKGMYVMCDVVANHMGNGDIADNRPEPLNQASSYHPTCAGDIDYDNQTSVENCRISGLPDVNTQSSTIRTLYQTWIKWLVTEYSFDGIRIDTVKHVEKDFWPGFTSAAGVYAIGEVFDGGPDYLSGYADLMPGLLNYATYFPLNRFYQQDGGSAQELADMHDTISEKFPDPAALGTFLDNHDNPRWLSVKADVSLFKNALAYVVLSRGIPIIYYGSEQSYSGAADPANREDLWRSNFDTTSDLYQTLTKFIGARKSAGGLAGDDLVHLYIASNAYAFSRAGGNLIVLTTNAGKGDSAQHCFNAKKNSAQWTVVSGSGTTASSDASGNLCLTISNGEPVILVSSSASASSAATTLSTVVKSSTVASISTTAAAVSTTKASTTLATSTKPSTTASASSTACPTAVAVTFSEKITTTYGDTIKLAGNTTQLGSWDASKALALSAANYTAANPMWSLTVNLPAGSAVLYKFVRVSSAGSVAWESDPNRVYSVPKCQGASAGVELSWR